MENHGIEDLVKLVNSYNENAESEIRRAYQYADILHDGQMRQSGEKYITHPLNVAYILAELHLDVDSIVAALLHDTIEDTPATKEDIENLFNSDVANLVDGVTKLAKMNFSSQEALNYANTRKIIMGVIKDVRIIIIKLADRLHNMRTLEYKSEFKRRENSLETLEIFVPLAYYIGCYRIKSELEDLSLKYLRPSTYDHIKETIREISIEKESMLEEVLLEIHEVLNDNDIDNEIKIRTKNIYGVYKELSQNVRISEMHDLLALKIMVDSVGNCYQALGCVHKKYHTVDGMFKDYICNPKANMYKSLHTTLFAPQDTLVQAQIRTFNMDQIASFGIPAYWNIKKGDAREIMQSSLREKFQVYNSLSDINVMFLDNKEFVSQVKSELFGDKVYVYTTKGEIIELPKGSTAIDFAYRIHTGLGNSIDKVFINDEEESLNYILQNGDRVKIIADENSKGPEELWLKYVKTTKARKSISEYIKK